MTACLNNKEESGRNNTGDVTNQIQSQQTNCNNINNINNNSLEIENVNSSVSETIVNNRKSHKANAEKQKVKNKIDVKDLYELYQEGKSLEIKP